MTEARLTLEALKLYTPLFQEGAKAQESLDKAAESGTAIDTPERMRLEAQVSLGDMAFRKIEELSVPLIRREIMKFVRKSHLRDEAEEIYDVIYYAGLSGMKRGLLNFKIDKLDKSATNYLFQWITTYAKKELLTLEAPMGVAPSRFQRLKKIAAVRKKLSEELQRDATDEEILDYFHSGRAEIKNFEGRKDKKGGVSESNKKITVELIQEQASVEKNLTFAQMFDHDEDQRSESGEVSESDSPFSETLFGMFMKDRGFDRTAVAVMKSELQYELTVDESALISDAGDRAYNSLARLWQSYLKEPAGDFAKFIREAAGLNFDEADVTKFASIAAAAEPSGKETDYSKLFEKEL